MKYRKLNLDMARAIRKRRRDNPEILQRELAKEFGCSQVNISLVLRNKIYREGKNT